MADQEEVKITDFIGRYSKEIRQFWGRLPVGVRVLMIAVIVLAAGAGAALAVLDRTEQEVLFSGLSQEDAASVIEHLKGKKIEYRIRNNGGTITVPKEHVHELRLALAAEGVPVGGGVGFELFDQQRFGMTEFEERISLRRALEGELSRTIARLDAVKNARTHLVLPKRSVLGARSTPAQASVVIELQRGRELSGGTVSSIVHLISSSVEGLNPDGVTVVDTRGRLLSSDASSNYNDKEFVYQKSFEQDMELRLREMLHQILGPDASVVRVTAGFGCAKRVSPEEHYDPDRSVLRSEQRGSEVVGSKANGAGGTPGTRSNLPGGTVPAASTGGQNKKRDAETRNYEVDKVVNRAIGPGSILSRLAVAVLVNGTNKEGAPFEPRPADELQKIEMAVRGAIGFDAGRGDTIEVQSIPFHVPEEMGEPEIVGPAWWKEWLPHAVGLAVALVLLIAIFSLRKKRGGDAVSVDSLSLPKPVKELQAIIERPEGLSDIPGAAADAPAALMGEVRQLFMEESEGSSRVIKSWLNDARQPEEQSQEVT
ncbi:MAG: flagellar M-ring protein FliF [Deltaproteobacteria bacterium]|nr:flagellar M-ring protein FliF [Deltaproteobacteria bacterium]